jgi:pyruvate/2-oxoglutarate dehydrogenase complex dihydrolipoamide dehydrogenase (E3) component
MVASARAAYVARRGSDFGVEVTGVQVDMKRVKARKEKISGDSRAGVEKMLKSAENCTIYRKQARFLSDHEVEAGGERLTAPRIFINVGARAVIPPIAGLSSVPFLTNSHILEIDFVPRSLIIVGGSYIGLEFAQMFRRFGSEVTVIERGPRLSGE